MKNTDEILIAKVIDPYNLVINKGSKDGIKEKQKFLIYSIDKENPIIDPKTHQELGYLEIIKGTGVVKHIQENFTTILSCEYNSIPTKSVTKPIHKSLAYKMGFEPIYITEETSTEEELLAFENPEVGDFAKPI
ncbi:TPA: hypothetical protein KRD93_003638 [Clostridioides difficile]|nr:hypothetical protein [Clostridioides difficile]